MKLNTHLDITAGKPENLKDVRGLVIAFFKHYDRIQIQAIKLVQGENYNGKSN